jgi:hypothetical protein
VACLLGPACPMLPMGLPEAMRVHGPGMNPVVRAPGRSMPCPLTSPVPKAADAAGADAGTLLCPLIHFTVLTWSTKTFYSECRL